MSEGFVFEFADRNGEPLRIAWSGEALAELDPAAQDRQPAWQLGGELDWEAVEALRIVSARLGDERTVAVVALRPSAATGHGDEIVSGALGDDDGFDGLERTLLSTEYGPDGLPRRVGLELYREDAGLPLRVAGEATATAISDEGDVRRLSAALELRCAGLAGVGVLDVLRRR